MKVGDRVRAIRDFSVEPLFDEGWDVKKGMIGFGDALDQDDEKKCHRLQCGAWCEY